MSTMETTVPTKLLTTLSQAADIVRSHDFIQVFSHYDADGVSSAAIIANALLRAGKEFRVTLFTTLNDFNMGIISRTKADCMIISDLGASYIDQLDELDSEIVVLDHHTVISEAKKVCYANPHLYGIDGMTSGCGATMSLLFAPRTLHMSLIGIRDMSVLEEAPGDRLPIQTFVCEYNEEMVREAIVRELAREGQVYYVYNRVNNIAEKLF